MPNPQTVSDAEAVLEAAYDAGARGAKLLEAALDCSASAEAIGIIIAEQFPDKDLWRHDSDHFAWIEIVQKRGAPPEAIAAMLLTLLTSAEGSNGEDLAAVKSLAFLCSGVFVHWNRLTRPDFVRVVERVCKEEPEGVLRHFQQICWAFGKYAGEPEWRNTSSRSMGEIVQSQGEHFAAIAAKYKSQAIPFLRRASVEVRVIYRMEDVHAILELPLDVRIRTCNRLIPWSFQPHAVVPPVRNLVTVYLAIHCLLSGGAERRGERHRAQARGVSHLEAEPGFRSEGRSGTCGASLPMVSRVHAGDAAGVGTVDGELDHAGRLPPDRLNSVHGEVPRGTAERRFPFHACTEGGAAQERRTPSRGTHPEP